MAGASRISAKPGMTRWILLVMCLMIALIWAVNYRAYFAYYGDHLVIVAVSGRIGVGGPSPFPGRGWQCGWHFLHPVWWEQVGLILPYVEVSPPQSARRTLGVILPFWLLFIVFALPTIWLFRRRRNDGVGCTQSGYNLTGNISGVCPECGHRVEAVQP